MNQLATVRSLQHRISEMQPLRLGDDGLPVDPLLQPLLPGSALRKGASIAVQGSLQLALAFLRESSARGAWCGAVGIPNLGFEAAEQLGLALERFILVPDPGTHAVGIAGMLSEVFSALVLRLPRPPTNAQIERLHTRLRTHGTALIVLGEWSRSDTSLRVMSDSWSGLGPGHGILSTRELQVQSLDRRGRRAHTVRFTEGRLVQ